MRPVVRGACPTDKDGKDVQYSDYADARHSLIDRIGECCSYCEMHLDSSLAVEHVKPKKPPGAKATIVDRELSWSNFLLACTNCNSTKGNKDVVIEEYVWPDQDNTFMAFVYSEGGVVEAAKGPDELKAKNMIKLVGLDHTAVSAAATDRRWLNRLEAWGIAKESLQDLVANDTPQLRRQIVRTVKIGSYWSVWMTVFKDYPEILREMIRAIPGTAVSCFDVNNNCAPVPRPANS